MILVDTNVLLDLMLSLDTPEARWSIAMHASMVQQETLACNVVILAELAGRAADPSLLIDALQALDIEILGLTTDAALHAGRAFRDYRARGGPRHAILADFLIGGHAVALGAALMTRDRRLARYFPDLALVTPA